MDILSDKPQYIESVLDNIHVHHSPPLDIYTKDNQIFRTLKGMYFSSKLDLENEAIVNYIKETAKPLDLPEPKCHTCYNYDDFDEFCIEFIDNIKTQLRIAYDVETTAAKYLDSKYKLAGFSLASTVSDGCYVILESIDYDNPDKEKILNRLADILRSHDVLVFNLHHEYIATKLCVDVDLMKEAVHVNDAYSMALLLKTESFKADVFKLKVLCNRLLGTENWASIIDDYIEVAMSIGLEDKINFNDKSTWTPSQKEKIIAFRDILREFNYTDKDIIKFIIKIQDSYEDWADQDVIPYTLIPSNMINVYGCYDSCYLLALFEYFENWVEELKNKLNDSLNPLDIETAYQETMDGQVMSAILTLNGVFVSEDRNDEVESKSKMLADKHYNELWNIYSDTSHKPMLKEFTKIQYIDILRKNYVLPEVILDLIPEGFKFIKTTPSFYSFECEILDLDLINFDKNEDGSVCTYLTQDKSVKVYKKDEKYYCKLLQKHLKPYDSLEDEDKILNKVVDKYIEDKLKSDGSLSVNVFKPMSGPDALYDILNKDLSYAHFIDRVILYEYNNLPDNLKNKKVDNFFDSHLLYDFDNDIELYCKVSNAIKNTVVNYISKQYSFKEIYNNLVKEGIKSFAAPIISYVYNIFTSTGCSVEEPKYSAFEFICQLKICRKYLRIGSTFIKGASGGYSSQMKIYNDSIYDDHLNIASTSVIDKEGYSLNIENTSNVVFGSWYANVADTGRWTATIHNVPAGAYCKRRFVSRYPGGVILANDMSQAEVRELAMLSQCKDLIDTIKDPTVDIHKRTASKAFAVPYDEVTSTQRKQTKEGIFSIVYGREEESLAQMLFKGDRNAAKRLMDAIFTAYPEIQEYLHNALVDAKKHGYLVTRRGAPIYINPFTEKEKNKGEQAFKRNVQNYAIQGGASYWCTGTLSNVQKLIDERGLSDKIKLICYIHDSIEIDVSPDVIDEACEIINYAFNELATEKYKVPTASDTVIGISMGEELDMKRIEKNHYTIKGNEPDIKELIEQLSLTYNVDIIDFSVDEKIEKGDDVSWIFTPRAELQWYDEITPAKYEIILQSK